MQTSHLVTPELFPCPSLPRVRPCQGSHLFNSKNKVLEEGGDEHTITLDVVDFELMQRKIVTIKYCIFVTISNSPLPNEASSHYIDSRRLSAPPLLRGRLVAEQIHESDRLELDPCMSLG